MENCPLRANPFLDMSREEWTSEYGRGVSAGEPPAGMRRDKLFRLAYQLFSCPPANRRPAHTNLCDAALYTPHTASAQSAWCIASDICPGSGACSFPAPPAASLYPVWCLIVLRRVSAHGARRVLRQVLSLISVAVLLHQQPFMVRPRREKLVPLTLAIGAAVRWAGPIVESSAINVTARSLLTPLEYVSSKPPRRTLSSAYAKTARKFDRLLDTNSTVQQLAGRPSPNLPLIGASLITSGSASAVLLPGAEAARQ